MDAQEPAPEASVHDGREQSPGDQATTSGAAVDSDVDLEALVHEAGNGTEADEGDSEASAPKPPPKPPEDPRDRRIRELHKLVAEKDELLRDYIKAHKQAQAQWEAHKQRLKRDRDEEVAVARGKIVEKFLTVSDNMERSLAAAQGTDSVPALLEGMQLVYKGFSQVLTELGLRRVDPLGQVFDPASMEALGIVPVQDASKDNMVVNCLQAGFAIGNRELRPALVQVGKFTG